MNRVASYIITKNKSKNDYKILTELCHKSKNLFNYVNYILRQLESNKIENIKEYKDLIKTLKTKDEKEFKVIQEYDLSTRLAKINQIDYRALKAQCSQQIINQVFNCHKLYFKTVKDWSKNKFKYLGKPKLPNYKNKNGLNILTYTKQSFSLTKDYSLKLDKNTIIESVKFNKNLGKIKQLRIIPKLDYFKIEIVYDKILIGDSVLKNEKVTNLAIDIGVDNLATITSDNKDLNPLLINGRPIKSINQFYNKSIANINKKYSKQNIKSGKKLRTINRKRDFKINDYFHKASKFIQKYCLENKVDKVFIGHNKNWKQKSAIGKINNQNFVQIPFNNFKDKIIYKLQEINVLVYLVEEAYTSKCSFLDNEEIQKNDIYKGKRIKRGLFKSNIGKIINADVNASLNILRKSLNKTFSISNKVFNPILINETCDVRNNQQVEVMCFSHIQSKNLY